MNKEKPIPNDKASNEWLDSQKIPTKYVYKRYWRFFLEFTGLSGDQILTSKKEDTEATWEKRVLEFKNWLIKNKNQSENSATTACNVVRGFFAYHRLDLKFRRTESVKIHEAKRKTEDYRFSREDLKKMCDVSDLTEKYVITAGKSFGLRAGDFLRLTRGDLEPYLERPVPISIGEYSTQKEKVKAFPFIDSDALPVIKLMIEKMNREGRTQPNERILTYENEIQLSRVLQRVTEKAGIQTGNKLVRFHCMRKFLIDRLSSFMSESKWKQIVGKAISEGAYVSPDSLREDYSRVMPETCFTQQGVLEERIKTIEEIMKGIPPEQREKMQRYGIRLGKRRETQHNGGESCEDGDHCAQAFEQIKESDLLRYLQAGWSIIHRLNNGEVIVKR